MRKPVDASAQAATSMAEARPSWHWRGTGGGSCSHLGGICVACDSLILAHRHCHLGCQSTESSMQVDPFLLPSNSNCLQAIALLLQTLETEGRQGKLSETRMHFRAELLQF